MNIHVTRPILRNYVGLQAISHDPNIILQLCDSYVTNKVGLTLTSERLYRLSRQGQGLSVLPVPCPLKRCHSLAAYIREHLKSRSLTIFPGSQGDSITANHMKKLFEFLSDQEIENECNTENPL